MTLDEANDVLFANGVGNVKHRYNGLCPDQVEGLHARDPECPVCQALSVIAAAKLAPMQIFSFDTEIGNAIAVANNVDSAKKQVMSLLKKKDQARGELEDALNATAPAILPMAPCALMAWVQ